MADDVVIRAEGLGKSYVIGHEAQKESYVSLRDVISRRARNLGRSMSDLARGRPNVSGDTLEEFWALKDVSFEIKQGDVVGVIGRNGAGKSTLLKILSRITEPTRGRVTIVGRVASLLEVGTGFHPELSGRENIFLNGAILGMSSAEIKRKFDEIVDFAGVEKFLDTPVKRYSSGMYVRLAFAVAAHLEPEILVVDEVLSVGDAEFQKKCIGKMQDVAGHGRTVFFVSHNIAAIRSLCRKGAYLAGGRLVSFGGAGETIDNYLADQTARTGAEQGNPQTYVNTSSTRDRPFVSRIQVETSSGGELQEYGRPLKFFISVRHRESITNPTISVNLHNRSGNAILHSFIDSSGDFCGPTNVSIFVCEIPFTRLNVGTYFVTVHLSGPPSTEHYETVEQACHFEVVRTSDFNPWGWRPEVCTYFEDASWHVETESQPPQLSARSESDS